jgi:hypothetical protein
MALITSAATGNFSAGATWTGGVVPTVGDEARASNGHTITIDVNTTCDEISNAGTGIFTLASGVTLTANVTSKSTTTTRNCLQFTAASPAVGTIVGNCTGGTVGGAIAVNNTASGTINITGNVTGGSAAANFAQGVLNSSTGTVTVTGNVTGGTGAAAYGAQNVSTGPMTITGNVIGGSGSNSAGALNSSTGTMTITGNVTGGSGSNSVGALNNSTGTITITGIATGGTNATASGVNNASTGTINLGRAKGTAYGPGNTSGLAAAVGALNAGLGVIEIQELEYGQYGMTPTSGTGIRLKKVSTNQAVFNYVDSGAAKTLVDATQGQMPAVTDVRAGVSYASGSLIGTCAVPPAASVGFGVPVDATTGTAALTPASVWDHLLSAITASSTIGTLLKTNIDATISSRSTATTAGIADAVWDEAMSGHTDSETYGGRIVRSINSNNELQLTGSHHAAADIHEFQAAVIQSVAFATSAVTLFTGAMRTEITPELDEIGEIHAIHGLKIGDTLTVTPTSRTAGAISQTISGDGTTTTTVSRD